MALKNNYIPNLYIVPTFFNLSLALMVFRISAQKDNGAVVVAQLAEVLGLNPVVRKIL